MSTCGTFRIKNRVCKHLTFQSIPCKKIAFTKIISFANMNSLTLSLFIIYIVKSILFLCYYCYYLLLFSCVCFTIRLMNGS